MATREPTGYYTRWLVHTFAGPWGTSSLIGSVLALLIPAALRYVPALKPWANSANDLLWQFPLAAFAALAIVRFFRVPKQLHREETQRAELAEKRPVEQTGQQRPHVIVSLREVEVDDDPNADGPYTSEYLRFVNVGPEAALMVTIDPVPLAGHDVRLWEPLTLLPTKEPVDRMPRGGFSTSFARVRKTSAMDWATEVRVPLVVRYTDRHGNHWTTPHAIVSRGSDIRIEPTQVPDSTIATVAQTR